ncbi:MAG: Vitamin B12 dependent methionine synthase activation subunit [Clostridia bacterium]|nr:Vitamin B12 dependent methionine synthase activation subunit [Clostridia bacterium]
MSGALDRGTGSFSDVSIPEREFFFRLGTTPGPETEECVQQLKQVVACRYCYVKLPVSFSSPDRFCLGSLWITSRALGKNLRECGQAYLFAATIGSGADRLIAKLGVSSPARQFITDAAASAMTEGLCDRVNALLVQKAGAECRPRFSPGFGDFPLDYQPELLRLTDASRQIGVTLTNTLFLTPSKSVTAIIGVKTK